MSAPPPRRPHVPLRPLWICRSCAAPWPCGPARLVLTADYHGDRVSLAIYLAAVLHDAARDLGRLNPDPGPDPADLFTRFIAWTRRDPP